MSFDIYSYGDIKANGWNRLAVNVYVSYSLYTLRIKQTANSH